MQQVFRQGDVLLVRVDSLPAGCKKVKRDAGRVVLAYGEVTGHAHAIRDNAATLYTQAEVDERFLEIVSSVDLLHEEHGTIVLEPGVYKVVHQVEYTPEAIRRVAD